MSGSVRPQRWQPTGLPCPWDSPGKNTGVGCHFLLQCVKVKSESEVAQSCPTPSNPMDCSPPGSSVNGNFQARVLEWGATAFSFANVSFVANLMGKKLYQLISTTLSQWSSSFCEVHLPWNTVIFDCFSPGLFFLCILICRSSLNTTCRLALRAPPESHDTPAYGFIFPSANADFSHTVILFVQIWRLFPLWNLFFTFCLRRSLTPKQHRYSPVFSSNIYIF